MAISYFNLAVLLGGICMITCITIDEEPKVCGLNDALRPRPAFAATGNIETKVNRYPWTVAILHGVGRAQKIHCSGSIISKRHVLTASHCFNCGADCLGLIKKEKLKVIVAAKDPFSSVNITEQGQEYKIKEFVTHPNYKTYEVYFDVAIIELDKPLIFSFTIHPICLPKMANTDIDNLKNVPATISGYGSQPGKDTSNIHFAPLTIMGQQECEVKHYDELETSDDKNNQALWSEVQSILDYEKRISRELVCTKATLEDVGTCRGDSGGPLIIEDNNRHIQVGIVYGSLDECSDKKFPSLYARLYDYDVLNFIRNVTFGDEIVEPVEVKATRKSEDEVYTCPGGSIIPKKYLCDGIPDCRDNSDEQNCPAAQCGTRKLLGIDNPKIEVSQEKLDNALAPSREAFFGEWPNMCVVQKTVNLGVLIKSIYISGGSLIAPNVI